MTRNTNAPEQLSLLDWVPPNPVVRFDPSLIRANQFSSRLSRAISVSLETCGRSRERIAEEMSGLLEKPVSVNMLNAYASVQREGHQISVPRFDALLSATRDRRLLEFMAEPMGWAVIERRYLPAIELAAVSERKKELTRHEAMLRRQALNGGRW
ncbi:hypothetical protein [Komagataeibacter oboediens]|uniref:DNA transposition protein n=1 Tax=Komagataeibacter oboediens TaxID=65958 RepID=A0ABS5SQT3_9PROT|nr:hypothetical protein [Komagataeibacter oboediens]MBL7232086.1 hypothetical protein [Komagataeibacter oboediens]MBT0676631.1 hypothetical protein [Komagataeibacter oboediens]MBT0679932.1 hypothetical protein [Komagataeibacter oboediens]